ncbi:hypothetical protein V3481_002914 [Fusarium oxysporum f. sp. vasinfectum]
MTSMANPLTPSDGKDHALCPKAYLHLLDESVVCGAIIRRYATLYSDYHGFAALLVMAMDYIGKDFHILHWERQALYTLYTTEQSSPTVVHLSLAENEDSFKQRRKKQDMASPREPPLD